ncbi:MAG TPA: CRISPR-associated RAMP protein Csx7 [Candidatus Obscuribacterales bacterium]
MFGEFQSRLTASGWLVCETAIRIGGGREVDITAPDLPVVRDAAGKPYIPGSSIKGVLRSYVESVLRAMGGEKAACDALNFDRCCIRPGKRRSNDGVYLSDLIDRCDRDERRLAAEIEKASCLVCAVFGSQAMASHVTFSDMPVENWFGQYQVRNGVSIDRDSGRAAEGKLYDFEVVPAGTRFRFRAVLENGDDWKRGVLSLALSALENASVSIGGASSRGLGILRLEALELRLIGSPDDLLSALDGTAPREGTEVSEENRSTWVQALRTRLKELAHA